jgi:type VI secretion system ImpA family protein
MPIPGEDPCGEWLRYEGTYDRIEDARRQDDATLPQGIWKTQVKRADWPTVSRLCQEALRSRSKDLQIAAWLLEAWLNLHGFYGLRPGLELCAGLCASFWDGLHPTIDDDDLSYRLAPIEWINRKVPATLKALPITAPAAELGAEDTRPAAFADWELALHRERVRQTEGGAQTEEAGELTLLRIQRSASQTPPAFSFALLGELEAAVAAIDHLAAQLDRLSGREQGALRGLRGVVVEISRLVGQLHGSGGGTEAGAEGAADEDAAAAEEGKAAGGGGGQRGLRSRADAYRMLQEAADYLMRTEPHSPTPYLVRRAVAWGHMSLGELLAEIVQTPSDLKAIYQLLAIRKDADSE